MSDYIKFAVFCIFRRKLNEVDGFSIRKSVNSFNVFKILDLHILESSVMKRPFYIDYLYVYLILNGGILNMFRLESGRWLND